MTACIATSTAATAGLDTAARVEPYTVEVASDLGAVEAIWRGFERIASASPYQRFDWVSAFSRPGTTRVAVVRDPAGQVAAMLPLVVTQRAGIRTASAIGGKHANFVLPLFRSGLSAELGGDRAQALLRRVGEALGADLLALCNVPLRWEGAVNPFASDGRASPSDAYRVDLSTDGDATLARVMSGPARKKMRSKERMLAKFGVPAFIEPRTEAEVDVVLSAFFEQKHARFRQLGVADPFADPDTQRSLRLACLAGLGDGRPAVELHALTLDGAVLAVFGGAVDDRRCSGMFVSFASDPETDRASPGDLLVAHVIRRQCERGRSIFDLGVGEARYKRTFCDEADHLVDVTVPVTWRGLGLSVLSRTVTAAKRRVKASPRAMALVGRLRRSGIAATAVSADPDRRSIASA